MRLYKTLGRVRVIFLPLALTTLRGRKMNAAKSISRETLGPTAAADVRAWLMTFTCALLVAMAFGAIVNIAVFLAPLAIEFGWPRADLSLAYSIATLGTGFGGIVMGHFADRLPVRRIATCGAVVCGASLMLLSQVQSLAELYAYHALLGVFGIGAIMAPLNSLASQWLSSKPGLAIGIVSAGGAAGQGVIPFLARDLVLTQGWRQSYLLLGIAYLAIMVPLALALRNPPRPSSVGAMAEPGNNPYALSRPALLMLLSVAVVFCCLCMATPIVHVATLAADRGLDGRSAAGMLTIMMVFGMAGRVAFGKLADRFGNLQAYAAASAGQTSLAFLFPYASGATELYALSALFGLVFSGAMTAFILCAREYAPAGRVGVSIGLVMFFGWLGMALGAWQGGVFYDLCGSYFTSFANASIGGVLNLLTLGLLYFHTIYRSPRVVQA
jgi:MFS family permease